MAELSRVRTSLIVLFFCLVSPQVVAAHSQERVYLDSAGVIRWSNTQQEVSLFGANYSLASACDYRAAGYFGADRKKLVDADLTHFVRMGWTGMRLCFWGDYENSDERGNLLVNDHLDVLDYTIAAAKKRGISILFTPITTYSSLWPDGHDSPDLKGFSKVFRKDRLGLDPAAIAAQKNYLNQILNHINPYTKTALKDEPSIVFIELINEPIHHPEDFSGSVQYINALADTVRRTGCRKILFYNLSQDFAIAPAIEASTVPGFTFAWYPTALNFGHELKSNFLRAVDAYPPMADPALLGHPRIVYEFDSADVNSGYMYPAMVRTFREAGAQFMSMFSYDMLATAPYNYGWQTHFLNLVYSPRKAISSVIAAEAARQLPRFSHWGQYPRNRVFGPFRVSYEEDLSELNTDEKFIYSNATQSVPVRAERLQQIVGVGSSPIIQYDGLGSYFLDKLAPGIWRLELYPDPVQIADPFARTLSTSTPSFRLIARAWPMTIKLSDLGDRYYIRRIDKPTTELRSASAAAFSASPGVYLLTKLDSVNLNTLPPKTNGVGLTDYVCPEITSAPPQIIAHLHDSYVISEEAEITVDMVSSEAPRNVTVYLRKKTSPETQGSNAYAMEPGPNYRYTKHFLPGTLAAGEYAVFFTADTSQGPVSLGGDPTQPESQQSLKIRALAPSEPLRLFDGIQDSDKLAFTRLGDDIRHGIFKTIAAANAQPGAIQIYFPRSRDHTLTDYTASIEVRDRVQSRGQSLGGRQLAVKARGSVEGQKVRVSLVESDGTAWSAWVELSRDWTEQRFPLDQLKLDHSVMLPMGYPGRWNYWLNPAEGRGASDDKLSVSKIERLQISLTNSESAKSEQDDNWIQIEYVTLLAK